MEGAMVQWQTSRQSVCKEFQTDKDIIEYQHTHTCSVKITINEISVVFHAALIKAGG
jgi:hypothetical protein